MEDILRRDDTPKCQGQESKNRLRNCHRLEETKETRQQKVKWDPGTEKEP